MTAQQQADPIAIPRAPMAFWVECLLWVFALSFALDYRASEARESGAGAGIDQLIFLMACTASSCGIFAIGWRYLLVRPLAWLIGFWALFLTFMLVNALMQNVAPGRSLRIILPLFFCLAGMVNAHIAGCMGIRPSRIVMPIFVAACTNVMWRMFHGFVFKGVTMENVRTEVQSPASNWIAAWIGCALLLRPKFHWTVILAIGVLFTGILITVTRSLLFPVMASALASSACFLLARQWGHLTWRDGLKKTLPIAAACVLGLGCLGIAALLQPALIERWNERLFHHASDRNITADISYLTRRAEADALAKILSESPVHFIHGKGIGASYFWDPAYLPEIYMVFPKSSEVGVDVWFAGHSTWTYAIFSGGFIALACMVGLLVSVMVLSLKSARANATQAGPDQWLAYLPFIATSCLLSETLTSNPFDERLTGIIFGVMAGLPQAFMVRASWIHTMNPAPSHV